MGKLFHTKKILRNLLIISLPTLGLLGVTGFCGILDNLNISSASAYLSDGDNAVNTFKVGTNTIEIVENFTPPSKLTPGVEFTKDVSVSNTGSVDCYVRIKALFTDSDMGKLCEVDFNTVDYVYNEEDNYYYLKDSLDVGALAPSLFTSVKIKESYDFNKDGTVTDDEVVTENHMKDFDILIYAESYQKGNFTNYEDAWEHFLRNKPTSESTT